MSRPIIEVDHVSKRYILGQFGASSFREEAERIIHKLTGREQRELEERAGQEQFDETGKEFWALKNISFEVNQGEVLGIIGRNGAGKSTLLKVMSRITEPTNGIIRMRGRIASLLEVGTGFHPELTGRENIYLNGAILGMRRPEIRAKFDEIVAFAGVEKFVDTPVKRYSSGMTVRLGFAVAAHLEPEILIVDEVLAVGDADFQKRCIGKMQDVSEKDGRTVLFVSHNMTTIQNLCQRTAWLNAGRLEAIGPTHEMISAYLSATQAKSTVSTAQRTDREGNGSARCKNVWIESFEGGEISYLPVGGSMRVMVEYEIKDPSEKHSFAIGIYNEKGESLLHMDTLTNPPEAHRNAELLCCEIPSLPLPIGRYYLNVSIRGTHGRADRIESAASFDVTEHDFYGTGRLPPAGSSKFILPYSWTSPQRSLRE